MTPAREQLIRDAWSREGQKAKRLMYRDDQPPYRNIVITPPRPVSYYEFNSPDEMIELAQYVFIRNRQTGDWSIVCEGITLETGKFGYL